MVSDFKLLGLGGPAVKFDLGKVIDAGGKGAGRAGILKLAVIPDLVSSGGAGGGKFGKFSGLICLVTGSEIVVEPGILGAGLVGLKMSCWAIDDVTGFAGVVLVIGDVSGGGGGG